LVLKVRDICLTSADQSSPRTKRGAHFPTAIAPPFLPLFSNSSMPSTIARICTALAVYSKCVSCPGAAPNPPLSAWHESTKSIVSFLGRASGRLRRWRAFRPQYRPLSRRCSVSQYSSSSFLWQVSVKRVNWWGAEQTNGVQALNVFYMRFDHKLKFIREGIPTCTTGA
jgi:hypothetical protein